MKSADLRDRNATARWRLPLASMGAVVVEELMRARGVVVREVAAEQAAEVSFVDHDDVIEAFPSIDPMTRSEKRFRDSARALEGR